MKHLIYQLALCLIIPICNTKAQDLKTISREYIDAYFALDQEAFAKYLHESVTWSDPTWSEVDRNNKPVSGKVQMMAHLKQATAGIDKMTYEIEQHFISGPLAVFEGVLSYTWNDTNAGKSYDFSIREVSVLEFSNGKIIKHTDYSDFKTWLQQYQKQQ